LSHSQQPTLESVRQAFRLIGEIRDLGDDVLEWRRHMVKELMRLTGSAVGMAFEVPLAIAAPDGNLSGLVGMVDFGWASDREADVFRQMQKNPFAFDESTVKYLNLLKSGNVTSLTEELVDIPQWRRSFYFNEARRAAGVDWFIYGGCVLPRVGCIHGFSLHRAVGEKSFTKREKSLVHLFHEELCRLWTDVPPERSAAQTLPPRLKQVANLLLTAKSEKQIAFELGLSRHSIHSYVKTLYKRLNVSSRSEFIATMKPKRSSTRPRLAVQELLGLS
jgi:DNA-binding CsgD family transcriptional regulator